MKINLLMQQHKQAMDEMKEAVAIATRAAEASATDRDEMPPCPACPIKQATIERLSRQVGNTSVTLEEQRRINEQLNNQLNALSSELAAAQNEARNNAN